MKSPFTGKEMRLISEMHTISFKKQDVKYAHRAFFCEESGEKFTTTELDELNLKQIQNVFREQNNIPFPDEIRDLRTRYGLSSAKMSELFGFGPNQYTLYENGEIPNSSNAKALSLALNPFIFKRMLEDNKEIFKDKDFAKLMLIAEQESAVNAWDFLEDYLLGESKPNIYSGFKTPSYEKLANMVVFFAEQNKPFKTALNKDLFYADFSHYKNYGSSISGCRYAAIPKGPVPDNFNSLFERMEKDDYVHIERISLMGGYEGEKFIAEKEFNEDLFEETEIETLQKVSSFLKNKSTKQIVDLSHEELGWLDNEKSRRLINYNYALDLKIF